MCCLSMLFDYLLQAVVLEETSVEHELYLAVVNAAGALRPIGRQRGLAERERERERKLGDLHD